MPNKLFITFDGNDLKVTQDTGGTHNLELYPKSAIRGVTPVKLNTKPSNGKIVFSAPSGTFTVGETITGGTSGATAVYSKFVGLAGFILSSVVGTFVAGETITGGTSAKTATVVSYQPTTYLGEWPYGGPVMRIIEIDILDGANLNIELQDVSNQATWSTGNQAGIDAAIADINTWLKA